MRASAHPDKICNMINQKTSSYHTGGCLCGAVRYEISAPLPKVVVCHCRDCQKASGSAAAFNARVPTEALKLAKGSYQTYAVTAESGEQLTRMFCAQCGSQLFSQRENLSQMMTVKIGTLDDPSKLELGRHIWTGSAMPWTVFDAILPCHEREYIGLRKPSHEH
jgi:hypothetical protein